MLSLNELNTQKEDFNGRVNFDNRADLVRKQPILLFCMEISSRACSKISRFPIWHVQDRQTNKEKTFEISINTIRGHQHWLLANNF